VPNTRYLTDRVVATATGKARPPVKVRPQPAPGDFRSWAESLTQDQRRGAMRVLAEVMVPREQDRETLEILLALARRLGR
jgi:hypothetical protein